jgi:hypothetical protein
MTLRQNERSATVKTQMNFVRDKAGAGSFSNLNPELTTLKLAAHQVEIADARALPRPASFAAEGFEIHTLPFASYDWFNMDWVRNVYGSHTMSFVKHLVGADHIASFHSGMFFRDTGENYNDLDTPLRGKAADFVHMDYTRASVMPFVQEAVEAETLAKYPHVKIFNVWRSLTPPPQDVGLAFCDQRTFAEDDWVFGQTVELNFPQGVPFLTAQWSPAQKWFHYSGMTQDEIVIFNGCDTDRNSPVGCIHGAFVHPDPGKVTKSRASIEFRVVALFKD